MRFLSYLLTAWLFILHYELSAQIFISGILLEQNNSGIPFATVGIHSKNIGTITERDGSFSFEVPNSMQNEMVTFSAVGFMKKDIPVKDFLSKLQKTIVLEESITELSEVVVSASSLAASRLRMESRGNFNFNTGTMRLDSEKNGGAMALLIEHENPPFMVGKTRLMIRHNSLGKFRVRVRLLAVDQNTGKPGIDLINKSLVFESDISFGWLKIDLTKENIWIEEESFFLVYEWIMDEDKKEMLKNQIEDHLNKFPEMLIESNLEAEGQLIQERLVKDFNQGVWFGSLVHDFMGKNYTCFYRLNSIDTWKRSGAIMAADITLSDIKRKFKKESVDE